VKGVVGEPFEDVPAGLRATEWHAFDWPPGEVRSQLVHEMRGARPEFLDRTSTRLGQSEPYLGLAPSVAADVLASIGRLFDTFLDCLAEGRDFSHSEMATLEREGSKRAKQGIPLEAVESMFYAGLHDAMSVLHGLATGAEHGDSSGLTAVAKLHLAMARLGWRAVHAMAEGHNKMQGDVARVIGEFVTETARQSRLREATAKPSYALVVVPPRPTDVDVCVSAAAALESGRVQVGATSPVYGPQLHAVVVTCVTEGDDLEESCSRGAQDHSVRVAVCQFPSVGEAIRKYDIIKARLHLVHAPSSAPQVIHAPDIAYWAMLHDLGDDLTSMLVDPVLGATLALPDSERGVILEQLDAALGVWGNKAEMARALGRHRNTVYSFLERVEELTGRRIDDPRGWLVLRLAVDRSMLRDIA
jgi:hypothetical protein